MSATAVPAQANENGKRQLPKGWRWVRLGDCLRLVNGRAYSQHELLEQGTPVIRIQNLNGGDSWYFSNLELDSEKYCNSGDLLYAWSATFGPYRWTGPRAIFHYHIWKVLPYPNLNSDFAYHLLAWITDEIRAAAHGIAMLHMTKEGMENWAVPLPPLDEQGRLADSLSLQYEQVQRARVAVEVQLEAARKLPTAYLRDVFGVQAAEWPLLRISDIGVLLPSKSVATDGDQEIQVSTTACLTEMGFDIGGIRHARMRAYDAREAVLTKGEVLIARSNTPELVGRAAMFDAEIDGVCASDLTIRLHVAEPSRPDFIAAYLAYLYSTGYWKSRAGGASGSMKKITRTQILALEVPVPAPDVQERVCADLQAKLAVVKRVIGDLGSNALAISQLPSALLRRAFNGEL